MKKLENINKVIIPVITLGILLVIWEASVPLFKIPQYILPSPSDIIIVFFISFPQMLPHLKVTLFTALTGLGFSIIIGLSFGALMDCVGFIKKAFYPFVLVSQTIPIIFLYPLLVIWFGFGLVPKILVVIIVCFFPICVNTVDGLGQVDPELVDLFRSMKASSRRIFFSVRLPSALPQFFTGLKISTAYSVIGAVIAEWLGAQKGVAVFMIRSFKSFSTVKVFASILLIILFSLLLMALVHIAERLIISWKFKRKVDNK